MSMMRSLQIGGYDLAIRSAATSTSDDDDATISMATACGKHKPVTWSCVSAEGRSLPRLSPKDEALSQPFNFTNGGS